MLILYLFFDLYSFSLLIKLILIFSLGSMIFLLDYCFYNNLCAEIHKDKLVIRLMNNTLIYHLNESIDLAIIDAYKDEYDDITESDINKALKLIKVKIDSTYFSIFIDACLTKDHFYTLNKIIFQIKDIFKLKELEKVKNQIIIFKYYFCISLGGLTFINYLEGNVNNLFLLCFSLLMIYYFVMYLIFFKDKKVDINNLFFNYFILCSLYLRPYVSFDVSLAYIDDKNKKLIYDKQAMLKGEYYKSLYKLKEENIDKYLLIADSLKKNILIKDNYFSYNNTNLTNEYHLKNTELIFIYLPLIFYFIIRFYL